MYRIEFLPETRKSLRMMPRDARELILAKIGALALAPFDAPNVRKLTGREGWRLRVGGWRVIYMVDGNRLTIVVLRIAPRGKAYQ